MEVLIPAGELLLLTAPTSSMVVLKTIIRHSRVTLRYGPVAVQAETVSTAVFTFL